MYTCQRAFVCILIQVADDACAPHGRKHGTSKAPHRHRNQNTINRHQNHWKDGKCRRKVIKIVMFYFVLLITFFRLYDASRAISYLEGLSLFEGEKIRETNYRPFDIIIKTASPTLMYMHAWFHQLIFRHNARAQQNWMRAATLTVCELSTKKLEFPGNH